MTSELLYGALLRLCSTFRISYEKCKGTKFVRSEIESEIPSLKNKKFYHSSCLKLKIHAMKLVTI